MKSKWLDPEPVLEWIKDNFEPAEILTVLDKELMIKEFSPKECKDHHGSDLLDEFTEDEVRKHFGIEEVEDGES